jgi:hypothetical protein
MHTYPKKLRRLIIIAFYTPVEHFSIFFSVLVYA